MVQIATITDKRQFTIPASLFKKLNLKEGQKVLVSEENGALKIESALKLIERLAGSISVPARFKGLTPDEMVEKAKKEYFSKI